jgi:SPP1 gp7 family putative phage head morphogenesis protein
MPTAIDQRLASLWHRGRIDLHADVERIVHALDHPYHELLRALLGLAGDPPENLTAAVDRAIADAFGAARWLMGHRFERIAKASHRRAFQDFARTVPRKWFRALHPAYFTERVADEPVKKRLTDEEWEEKLAAYTFEPPDAAAVAEFLDHKGPGGLAWDERLQHWEGPVRDQLKSQLTQGLSAGEGLSGLRARLKPLVDGVNYKAQRIARTEGRRVAELSQQRVMSQAGDLIAAQEILATLDVNTRPHHALRHGKRYDRQQDGSFVAADGEHLPDLPDEPNCRCFPSPILATPEEFAQNAALAADFRNASADLIPDPGAYVQWWTAAEEPRRIAAVGVRRYRTAEQRLGRKPEWTDFLLPNGKLIPIAQLKGEDMPAWERRRAAVEEIIQQREALLRRAAA